MPTSMAARLPLTKHAPKVMAVVAAAVVVDVAAATAVAVAAATEEVAVVAAAVENAGRFASPKLSRPLAAT